jgi:putative DNA primase/helicase
MRFNRMSRRQEIVTPGYEPMDDDKENQLVLMIKHYAKVNGMPFTSIQEHIDLLTSLNGYHPIVEALKENPWDGVDRLTDFVKTIETKNPDLDYLIIRTWMRAAIAAAHSIDGFENHGVLVLQGDQGIGKTKWVKTLDPIGCGAVKADANIEPRNKDSVIGLARFWIAEIGELDGTFNKNDIAHLKGFITSNVDDVRVPWGRKESRLIRRTAFVATVNNPEFLIDTTGNRRWWTVSPVSINYEHGMDMLQVWAQVKVEWEQGGLVYLPKGLQDQVNERNKDHEVIDPIFEAISTAYDWTQSRDRKLTCTDVLREIGYEKPTQRECTRAGIALTKITGKKMVKHNGSKIHLVPNKLVNWNL